MGMDKGIGFGPEGTAAAAVQFDSCGSAQLCYRVVSAADGRYLGLGGVLAVLRLSLSVSLSLSLAEQPTLVAHPALADNISASPEMSAFPAYKNQKKK